MIKKTLYIVVPCYNESEMLPISIPIMKQKLNDLIETEMVSDASRILFVDDGSKDNTWKIIRHFCTEDNTLCAIKLSRNRGHQSALVAGISYSVEYADAIITIDSDLQDDINCIDKMLGEFYGGKDIVFGVRAARDSDTAFKRNTAQTYYKLLHLLGIEIVYNHADYRLLSKRAAQSLLQYKESNLFIRGIVPDLGYDTSVVTYNREERAAGKTKYPLRRMIALALDGITSFSVKPVRLILLLGVIMLLVSIVFGFYVIAGHIMGKAIHGWTSTVISIWLFGSLQLISTGIIGEYIGKTYLETKHRPRYFIERIIKDEEEKQV
ncbi:MAG: glycosyltransferase [Ruminococcaceae bacterium]|nr:glycosyltransferase [Oscillospiraceae bacterium]